MILHYLRRNAHSMARPLYPPLRLPSLRRPSPASPSTSSTRSVVSHHGPRRVVIVPKRSSGQHEPPPPPPSKHGFPPYFYALGIFSVGGTVYYFSSFEETPYTGRKRPIFVSRQTELQLGEASNKAMLRQFKGRVLPPDHPTVRLLRKVGRKLARAGGRDAEKLPWEFHVVDRDEIMNAAAMPGGKVVIFTGLKQCVNTEEELAAVIGHEISHVLLRHSAEQMASMAMVNSVLFFLALLGLPVNELTLILGDLVVHKPNSRLHEKEADRVGVLLCARAGYDPSAAVRVFERMAKVEEKRSGGVMMPGFLSTHPAFPERISLLKEEAAKVRPIYEESKAQALFAQAVGASGGGG
ncbi:m48-family peptidase [Nannochloropsis oceanica]